MMNADPSLDTHRCPSIDVDVRSGFPSLSIDVRVSISRCCGAAVAALGLLVLFGWWLRIPALTTVLPGLVSMRVNTAAGFLLTGVALALTHWSAPRAVVLMRACASLALVMAVLTLVEYLADIDLGIDNLLIADVGYDPSPGPMAFANAAALAAASAVLLMQSRRSSKRLRAIEGVTGLVVAGIGALGLTGYAVNVDALYSWPELGTIALHSAAGFCALGIGLWLARAAPAPSGREEVRIAGRATGLIALVSALIGLAALAATEGGLRMTLSQGLQATLHEYTTQVRISLDLRTKRVAAIASRGDLRQWLRLLAGDPSRSDLRAAVRNELEQSAADDLAAIELVDASGERLAHLGVPLDRATDAWYVPIAAGTGLTWHNGGLHVRHDLPLRDSLGRVGTLIVEQHMAEVTRGPPKLKEWLGKSSQLLLCSRRLRSFECFRARSPFDPVFVADTDPLAALASRALRGERGVAPSLGEQQRRLVVGYAPVEPYGLVALLSVRSSEIYQPIGRQFRWVILLITASSVAGYLLVRGWVRPLAASLEERVWMRTAELAGTNTRLAESEQRFRTTFESSPVAMMLTDPDGCITLVNPQAEKLFGYPAAELLGRPVEMLVPSALRSAHMQARHRFVESASSRPMGVGRELRALHKDGHELVVEIGLSPVRSEADPRVLATILDLSEYRRQAEELRQINAALKRSNQELERFAYVASHDLQTPLRSITSFAELLGSNYGAKLDTQGGDWLHRITESTSQLQMLIRDLLEYSRIEAETHLPERVPMAEVLTEVLELLDEPIRSRSALVTSGELPGVMGRRSQLVKLLLNLIENALKYHGSEPPRVHVSAAREDGAWHFRVTDNGIGIAARHHERIFEIFERLHSQRAYPGTGIGLAACRRVVEQHGGRIWVESEPGRGSVFHFTISEPSDE